MDLRSIYISNGTGIFVLLMLFYVSRTKILGNRVEDKVFTTMLVGIMVACCMEALSYTIDGKNFVGARLVNYVANTYLYTANLLMTFSVVVYVDLSLYGDTSRIVRCYKPQIVIGIGMLSMNIVNFFVPVTFIITESNVYGRLPFGYVCYFVILYYCLTALMLTRRYEKENGAKAFLSIGMFLVPIFMGAGLQSMFYGLSLAWLSAAVGLTGLFMMQQNELAYIDSLANVYNRQYLNHILSAWVNRGNGFVGVMVDVDRFKSINDTFGHSEGDAALKVVSDVLKRARMDNEWVFRFAGDEFVVLRMTEDRDGLVPYLDHVEKILAGENNGDRSYQISLSYGMAYCDNGDIDEFMRVMDKNMYVMKESHHCAGLR